jgi:hypothetical protein
MPQILSLPVDKIGMRTAGQLWLSRRLFSMPTHLDWGDIAFRLTKFQARACQIIPHRQRDQDEKPEEPRHDKTHVNLGE